MLFPILIKKQTYQKSVMHSVKYKSSGIILLLLIAIFANSLGKDYVLLGGAAISLIVGILVRNFLNMPSYFQQGIDFTVSRLLKLAIILLGFGLTFEKVLENASTSLTVILLSVVLGLSLTFVIAKVFRITGRIPILLAMGTAICGATAIMAISPIIKARDEETTYAINTIFIFNLLAVFVYPAIGYLFHMSDSNFGTWVGVAIHDTSSVVAAGYALNQETGDIAIVVKLTRTLMLIPLAILLSIYVSTKEKHEKPLTESKKTSIAAIFPYFILFFAIVVLANTIFPLPQTGVSFLNATAKFLILMVMAGIGLKTDFRKVRSIGLKPVLVGLITSVIMGTLCIAIIMWLL